MKIVQALRGLLEKGHARSVRAKKNIVFSILFRVIGMAIGFAYYPLSIEYLDATSFGIFITIESIIDWFAYMDIGIGRGLRNKFGIAIAEEDHRLARSYISTAFFIIGALFVVLFLLFTISSFFIDWSRVLNTDPAMRQELTWLVIVVFFAFSLRFVASLVYEVFNALQRTSMLDLFSMAAKVLFLVLILGLIFFVEPSLLYFGSARSFAFAVVPLVVAIYFFRTELKQYAPAYRFVELKYARSLMSLGLQFFFIQLALLIINETNHLLIIQFVGPAEVTVYASAFKYFSVVVLLFSIASNPLWAAYIEAYQKQDYEWVRKVIKQMIKVWGLTVLAMFVMVPISPWVFRLWLGEEVVIPYSLSILVALTVIVANWNTIFNLFINGTGKIRMQMYATLGVSLLNIPLCIFLVKYFDLGTNGIVLGSILSLLLISVLAPIQVYKILRGEDKGIWGR